MLHHGQDFLVLRCECHLKVFPLSELENLIWERSDKKKWIIDNLNDVVKFIKGAKGRGKNWFYPLLFWME